MYLSLDSMLQKALKYFKITFGLSKINVWLFYSLQISISFNVHGSFENKRFILIWS